MPWRKAPAQHMLATVLFTDIVRSTERAAELGDRSWRQLLARHHAVVRRELRRHRGREMDTAGDGFFATFDQPADAIQCAIAVAERLRPLGIEIRAGVHMGQVEVAAPKVQGIAVNIGSRVAAKAAPGQVLVSSTVRDALAGSDIQFADQGLSELKGVPGEWRLFAVQRDERLVLESVGVAERPSRKAAGADEAPRPLYRRPIPVAIAAAVVAGMVAGGVLLMTPGDGQSYVPVPNSVARIDPVNGHVEGGVPVGTRPIGIASANGAVWIANFTDRTLQRIDPSTGQAGSAIGLSGSPTGIAVGGCCVWVTSGYGGVLFQYNLGTNAQPRLIQLGGAPTGVAFGEHAVWITDRTGNRVIRLDPETARIRSIPLEEGSVPTSIVVGAGAVWVAESLKGAVVRIDPGSLDVSPPIPLLSGQPSQLAFGEGYVWVTNYDDDSVTRIDPRGNSPFRVEGVGNGPTGIAAGDGAVWVANSLDGTVARIDPRSGRVVVRVKLGFSPDGVAVTPGAVWITLHTL